VEDRFQIAEARYHDAIKRLIPVGYRVVWYHGEHQRIGVVLGVTHDHVFVEAKNGSRTRIGSYRIRSIERMPS
jgi:hypothetical protein